MSAGYSTTPLAKKLGIKNGFTCMFYNKPKNYFELFSDFPSDVKIYKRISKNIKVDFIHLFLTSFSDLLKIAPKYKEALLRTGILWVSWPKGGSSITTNLKRDLIRDYLLKLGLVDIKVVAIDENWSGLKFVYRIKDR